VFGCAAYYRWAFRPRCYLGDVTAGEITLAENNLLQGNSSGVAAAVTNITLPKEGARTFSVAASTTAATAGGALSISAATGSTSGAGGAASLSGGVGGTSGAGGAASLIGGAAGTGSANAVGGAANVTGGAGQGTSAGGAVVVTSGASENGTAVNPGASGAISLVVGAAGTATTGIGGAGGAIAITGAAGGASTGASSVAGAGSDVSVTAGAGGASSGGGDTGGRGGNVIVTVGAGGAGATAGEDGAFFNRANLGALYFKKMGAPTAKTTNATLTAAEVLSGWITVDGAGSATSTQTMPSGTDLAAAFPAALAAGDCFDFSVINISTDAAENAIIAFGSDITGIGSMIIEPNDSGSTYSAGTFRLRYSGANVWVMYRIG
jgi:hypothetical protein